MRTGRFGSAVTLLAALVVAPAVTSAQVAAPRIASELVRRKLDAERAARLEELETLVAQRTREDHPAPGEPPAQIAAREIAEDQAEQQVAGKVQRVGMQGQGRHHAPPFACLNQPGRAHAGRGHVCGCAGCRE